jgi:hypothetical protein
MDEPLDVVVGKLLRQQGMWLWLLLSLRPAREVSLGIWLPMCLIL